MTKLDKKKGGEVTTKK